ncbi:MAG: sigma-70 family RNA polymerase sigma factor [Cyclobacteriaceae bacterium]|nr:sigma-70 family RNA polymerase sigma factor [Cyclobacteriaceae bacterium]
MKPQKLNTDPYSGTFTTGTETGHAKSSLPSEREIWMEFKHGSDSAFTYIYRQYLQILYNYGRQILNNESLLQDCIQDMFMDIIRNRKNLADVQSIKFYLFTALRHKIFRKLKKEKNTCHNQLDEAMEAGFEIMSSHEAKMINNQLDEDKQRLLNLACDKLTKKQREAILLYYYEGFSYQQIAQIMGMNKVKSVRVLIYRAIDVLHGHLILVKDQLLLFLVSLLAATRF